MAEKMKDQEKWKPDFGPNTIHPTGGVTAIGARMPLIAYNINLDTSSVEMCIRDRPSILVYIWLHRHIMEGMVAGAVKG